jgi:hypothetical protein
MEHDYARLAIWKRNGTYRRRWNNPLQEKGTNVITNWSKTPSKYKFLSNPDRIFISNCKSSETEVCELRRVIGIHIELAGYPVSLSVPFTVCAYPVSLSVPCTVCAGSHGWSIEWCNVLPYSAVIIGCVSEMVCFCMFISQYMYYFTWNIFHLTSYHFIFV